MWLSLGNSLGSSSAYSQGPPCSVRYGRCAEHPDQRRTPVACAAPVRCIWLFCGSSRIAFLTSSALPENRHPCGEGHHEYPDERADVDQSAVSRWPRKSHGVQDDQPRAKDHREDCLPEPGPAAAPHRGAREDQSGLDQHVTSTGLKRCLAHICLASQPTAPRRAMGPARNTARCVASRISTDG